MVEVWQAISAITSVVLILITGVYAYLTFRLARIAEEQSWEISRARVVVRLATNQGGQLLLLHFENIGITAASNFTVTLDKPVFKTINQNQNLQDIPLFKNGLKCFSPGAPIQFAIGVAHQWLNENANRELHPSSFNVTATYQTGSRQISETFAIDVVDQLSMSAIQRDYLDDFGRTFPDKFTRSMDNIARQLDDLSDKSPPRILERRSWSEWFWKDRSWESWRKRW